MKVCISNRFHIYNRITEPVPTNTFSQRAKHFRHNIKHMTTHLKTKHVKQLTDIVTKHDRPSSSATNIQKKGHVTNIFDFIFDFIFELIFLTATNSIIFLNIGQTTMRVCISEWFPTNTFSRRGIRFRHYMKHATTHLETKRVKQLPEPSSLT